MKTFTDILRGIISEDLWNLTAKDFILKKYPKASPKFHNDRWFIMNHGAVLGFGPSEEKAWENTIENKLKKIDL